MKVFASLLASLFLFGIPAFARHLVVADNYNIIGNGTGFGLSAGINSGISPPRTRLSGAVNLNLRYIPTTVSVDASVFIKGNKLRLAPGHGSRRFTLSANGVTPLNFAPSLGTWKATPNSPVIYELAVKMANSSQGSRRSSFALSTAEGSADTWSFGIQIYRDATNNAYVVGKRIESGSSGLWTDINSAITNTPPGSYGSEIRFLLRVTDAGDESSAFNSRVQLSLNGGLTWFYDTQSDPDLPNGWRLHGAARCILWDTASAAGPVTYDDFSLELISGSAPPVIAEAAPDAQNNSNSVGSENIAPAGIVHSRQTRQTLRGPMLITPDSMDSPDPDFMVSIWQASDAPEINTIEALRQTHDGFLWLRTPHGLVRFDGLRFQPLISDANGISNNQSGPMEVDASGQLWFAPDDAGILCLDGTGIVAALTNAALPARLDSLCSDGRKGLLWVDAKWGLGRITTENPPRVTRFDSVGAVADCRWIRGYENELWLVTPWKVQICQEEKFREVAIPGGGTLTVAARRDGGLWFARDGKLRFVTAGGDVKDIADFSWNGLSRVSCMMEDSHNRLWIGTASQGLFYFDGDQCTQVVPAATTISCLFEDDQGSIWAGTRGGGLTCVRQRQFYSQKLSSGSEIGSVRSLAQDDAGRVWAAVGKGGLGYWERGSWHKVEQGDGWPGLEAMCVFPAKDGGIWISTAPRGLWHWADGVFTECEPGFTEQGEPIMDLLEDRRGRLWMVTDNEGVYCREGQKLSSYSVQTGLPSMHIRHIVEDEAGDIWVGDWQGGIARFRERQWELICNPSEFLNAVQGMAAGGGAIWISTSSGELLRVKKGKITWVGAEQGLPSGSIHQLLLDRQGSLWATTSHRLFRVSLRQLNEVMDGKPSELQVLSYGRGDGISEVLFANLGAPGCRQMPDGELWFATANGAIHFKPGKALNETRSKAFIEQVLLNGKPVSPTALTYLRPGPGRLEFRFTAPCLTAAHRIHFRYKMEGVDPEWVDAGTDRSATYTTIPSGRHVFRVMASSPQGVWSAKSAEVVFAAHPYFWQTTWFFACLGAVAAGSSVWGIRRAHARRLVRRLEQMRQQHLIDSERARIAKDIHDELGANLTSIGLLADMGGRHKSDPAALSRDLRQISQTARESVVAMDVIVWALNPGNDSLDHCANYVAQFTREFFGPTNLRTRLRLPDNLPAHPMDPDVRHQLLLILKESFNNIVRHAEASEVRVELASEKDQLRLSISDNGNGFAGQETGGGQDGLRNLRERIEKLEGTLRVVSVPGSGTTLDFAMPVHRLQKR